MMEEKRRPGYLKLGLVDQRGQVIAMTPLEFHEAVLAKLRNRLPGVFIHTRAEVLKAAQAAYQEVIDEMKAESVRR
jgi:hypothetical protein